MTIKPKWDAKSAGEYKRRLKAEREDDDDIQDYKKPWVGLTELEETGILLSSNTTYSAMKFTEAKLKEKNT